MKKIIKIDGRRWQLRKATARRLIFHPADNAGKQLKQWRKAAKLNQRHAAEKLGISQTHLAKIELGARSVPDDLLTKIGK